MEKYDANRFLLKDSIRKSLDFRTSDQSRNKPPPLKQEPVDEEFPRINLPTRTEWRSKINGKRLESVIGDRKSRRKYTDAKLSVAELSYLIWATQGLRSPGIEPPHFRTVPSAGARHSFETYLILQKVETIAPGLYRYLPLSHELVLMQEADQTIKAQLTHAVFGQSFVAEGAAVFIWATVPYRMEWRYMEAAHRVILLDAGHVCQNLYLACEDIDAGTCAIAAYDQEAMDTLLGVDGEEQFTIYLAPVGKV